MKNNYKKDQQRDPASSIYGAFLVSEFTNLSMDLFIGL